MRLRRTVPASLLAPIASLAVAALAASCGGDPNCGPGTMPEGDVCVPIPNPTPRDAAVAGADALPGQDAAPTDQDGSTTEDGGTSTPDGGVTDRAVLSVEALDFGRVLVGATVSQRAIISNPTAMPIAVRPFVLSGPGTAVFHVEFDPAPVSGRIMLAPGATAQVNVHFSPTAVGVVTASLPFELCPNGCEQELGLSGEGVLDEIDCQPPAIDFGFVNTSTCGRAMATCTNVSTRTATIVSVELAQNTSPAFVLPSRPGLTALPPGGSLDIPVRYCPGGFQADMGLIAVTVIHPNPARSTRRINLTGQGGGPDLQCNTLGSTDLGVAAVGQTVSLTIECENRGNVPVLIQRASLGAGVSNELTLAASINRMPVTPPFTLAGAKLQFVVTFRPTMPGAHSTTLTIESNDSDTPQLQMPITAQAIAGGGCVLQIAPLQLDFGSVLPGRSAELTSQATNSGNGPCGVTLLGLESSLIGPMPMPIPSPFSIVSPTSAVAMPGQSVPIRVRFQPLGEASYVDRLMLRTTDPALPTPAIALEGVGVSLGAISISPTAIDFGTVAPGCRVGGVRQILIANDGRAPISVRASIVPGSSTAFVVTSTTPRVIPQGQATEVAVRFNPTAAGSFQGNAQVEVQGYPPVLVALSGSAAAGGHNVLTFPGTARAEIDLLLVIDDSCSMQPYQSLLANVAQTLIARADASGTDYHIGVTTTDGMPNVAGRLRGMPAVITGQSATRVRDLAANIVGVGIDGSPEEMGLHAAAEAVTNASLLSTTNAGFLRPNGQLSVVILTDEHDQSLNPPDTYVAAMANRPVGQRGAVTVSAISGGSTGCNSPSGPAEAAGNYLVAIASTGGASESICDPDYAGSITRIADVAFGGSSRQVIALGSPPAPGSVEVRFDGQLVPTQTGTVTNWRIDYRNARIVFERGRGPSPQVNLEVRYDAACVPLTCGTGATDPGEQCDDANPVETDACPSTCTSAFCGDGFVRSGTEQCDDGNTIPGDGCNHLCTIEGCGNGITEPPEECDLGAQNSNSTPNGCRTSCKLFFCGDRVHDSNEACDDGNTSNNDACVGQCAAARCGDGFVQLGVEDCDDGNMIDNDVCSNACRWNIGGYSVSVTRNATLAPSRGIPLMFRSEDDDSLEMPIGFPFVFAGTQVTEVAVGTNGLFVFERGMDPARSFNNTELPDPIAPNTLLAWWWDDLILRRNVATPAVATSTLAGVAPNRVRVFTFLNVRRYGTAPGIDDILINAEIRLHETSNVIEVHYGQLVMPQPGIPAAFDASVGWESVMGIRGADVLGCSPTCGPGEWPANTITRYTP